MNGMGRLTWPDGVEYVGMFKDDKFHGQGVYHWADGKTYTGGWLDGVQHGNGTILSKGMIKVGHWENGIRKGNWLKETEQSSINDIESQYGTYSHFSAF